MKLLLTLDTLTFISLLIVQEVGEALEIFLQQRELDEKL